MSTAIQSDPYAPFLAEAFQEFRIWMNQNKAKSRFTEEKRTEYCHWIRNPDLKPEPGPDQQRRWNHKYEAVLHYRIHDDDGKLYRTATAKRDQGRANRRVICDSEIFDRIREVHLELGHAGVNKVASAVTDRYHGIRKKEVDWLLKRCQTCVLKRQNRSHTPLEPVVFNPPLERIHTEPIGIVSRPLERIQVEPTSVVNRPLERIQTEPISIVNRPLERVQIDLVDFRHEPDRLYWWVLYIEDHFSKFTSLYPLKSKAPRDVAGCMAQWIAEDPKHHELRALSGKPTGRCSTTCGAGKAIWKEKDWIRGGGLRLYRVSRWRLTVKAIPVCGCGSHMRFSLVGTHGGMMTRLFHAYQSTLWLRLVIYPMKSVVQMERMTKCLIKSVVQVERMTAEMGKNLSQYLVLKARRSQ
ncbi:hypothetical protein BZA05DRAFT_252488 [Tricharina praecox]|uniref:uncharacterized protein n=1 Tax=Tricharina praecox TaxID=43433 RepID=UPI0022210D79|nr:uncharacterized protein BZA05DRAFT_252488 [Tricharina praecox]KAI5854866.1 hypothetical protein BZA05DRAFT_252488 [Tricharina praecox]